MGAELLDLDLRSESGFKEAEYEILLHEFKAGIAEHISNRRAQAGMANRPGKSTMSLETAIRARKRPGFLPTPKA